tara:strand:- start:28053 stop:29507 length:1455 start_codon:yes stop_codon:yes gene_type:complete
MNEGRRSTSPAEAVCTGTRVYLSYALFFVALGLASLAQAELPDFSELVEENEAAVVNISSSGPRNARSERRMPYDERLEEFYRFFGPPGGDERQAPRARQSLGSGFIIEEDGYILTNHHVVDEASEIIVRMSDRTEYVAEVVGTDPRSDLALLKVEADEPLPFLEIGSSEEVRVGQWVLAIGSPFGFDYSVTAGIVSAKGRSLNTRRNGDYVPFIQTDVAINPGNSGGPLFNLDGEVIGINSQIYSNSGGFMGVSFAIPIDVAMEVTSQLKENGKVARGWLGVEIFELTRDLAEGFGLERPRGAFVAGVLDGSPAAAAGLQEEDIILEFGGHEISRSGELPQWVGRSAVGKAYEVVVFRGGREVTLSVTLGELPDNPMLARGGGAPRQADAFGMTVAPPSAQTLQQAGIEAGIEVIRAEGLAGDSGFIRGDIVVRMRGVAIQELEDFSRVVAQVTPGDIVPIRILRQTRRGYVAQYLTLRVPDE